MRVIGVVTVGRSDYSIYLPVLRELEKDPHVRMQLFVGGMHLLPQFGLTEKIIEADDFNIVDRIDVQLASDSPEDIAKSIGTAVREFARSFTQHRPDILLTLGDRFEMFAAVVAALPLRIPVAHIHGGELSEGAIDDALRHSISKMSHLHFVSNEVYKKRLVQMGEEPWRITISGAPALDNLTRLAFLEREQLEQKHRLALIDPVLIATYHPVTLEYEHTENQVTELLRALENIEGTIIFTYPNTDAGSKTIIRMIEEFAASHQRVHVVVNLGTESYYSLMKIATVMVGNSSSGIIEAASFALAVVNIGDRQRGRLRGPNVLDATNDRSDIEAKIRLAMSPSFQDGLSQLKNPYGNGSASPIIAEKLSQVELSEKLLIKKFHDLEG